jgi:hypothetical protein
LSDASNQGEWLGQVGDAAMGQFIERTMNDNIQSVSDGFGEQSNVVKIGLNATDDLNLQKIGADTASENRQAIDLAHPAKNLQGIPTSVDEANRQTLDIDASPSNRQTIDLDGAAVHRESLSAEERLQNIHQVVEVVSDRLDRFETDHFRFLQVGRAFKSSDSFALMDEEQSDVNRQLVDASYVRMGVQFAPVDETQVTEEAVEGVQSESQMGLDSTAGSPSEAAPTVQVLEHVHVSDLQHRSESQRRGWLWRGRGFVYVQLVVASMTLAFASPIDTQKLIRREIVGPLFVSPTLMPAVSNSEHEFDNQLLPVPSVR